MEKPSGCDGCYWQGKCPDCSRPCSDYTPINSDEEDMMIHSIIEQNRLAFQEQWERYVHQFD